MSRIVSASGLERGAECPTSAALEQVRQTGEAAIIGTDNHSGVESQLREYRKTGDASKLVDGLREVVDGYEVIAVERAFVVNTQTATVRDLGEDIGRNYGDVDGAHEVPLTVDVVLRHRTTGKVKLLDWKSRRRVTRADRNWQVKAQVVAVMEWLSIDSIEAGICYLDDWECDTAHFDAFDSGAIAQEIGAVLSKVQNAKGTDPVHIGPWCDYCSAQTSCPGRAALVKAAVGDTGADLVNMSDEQAGEIWVRLNTLLETAEKARDVLKDRARRTGLPLPNGKHLRLIECTRRGVDTKKAEQMMTAAGMPVPIKVSHYTQLKEVKVDG
jgi:hypothetical protein